MKRSELKSAIKEVVREAIAERCGGGHLAGGAKGKRMFKHIKAGYKGEKSPEEAERIAAATVNKNLDEAGLTSEAGERIPQGKLAKLNPNIIKTGSKGKMSLPPPKKKIKEGGPQYKVVSPTQARVQKDNQAYEMQCEPTMTEEKEQEEEGEARKVPVEHPLFDYFQKLIKLVEAMANQVESNPTLVKEKLLELAEQLKGSKLAEASYKKVSKNETDTEKENKAKEIQTDPEVTENHKVQARSFVTVNDAPNDPNNVRDPENPASNGA